MRGRRFVRIAVVAILAASILVAAGERADAVCCDQFQAIELTTSPSGTVIVGQPFSLDAIWTNLTGGGAISIGIAVTVPAGFRVELPIPTDCAASGSPSTAQHVNCFYQGGTAAASI